MLEGTLRPHAEVLGVCPPNLVPVTVRDAAVQAVMAGCAAVHFTVVLAATEAMLSDEFNLHGKEQAEIGGGGWRRWGHRKVYKLCAGRVHWHGPRFFLSPVLPPLTLLPRPRTRHLLSSSLPPFPLSLSYSFLSSHYVHYEGTHATTMGATPCIIVNGPIRNIAGFSGKHGALGSGTTKERKSL
jgi:hypothetical protein